MTYRNQYNLQSKIVSSWKNLAQLWLINKSLNMYWKINRYVTKILNNSSSLTNKYHLQVRIDCLFVKKNKQINDYK